MNRQAIFLLIVILTAVQPTVSLAGISGTKHDLRLSNVRRETCLPCHVPHGGDASTGYLWSHAYQDGSVFTAREGTTLGSQSLTCLGCHDGQTSRDDYAGGNNTMGPITGYNVLGTDLLNDHPVGIPYPTNGRYTQKTTLPGDQPGVDAGSGHYLPLYYNSETGQEQVECSTCHDPHQNPEIMFLRFSNQGSALCKACHAAW